MKILVGMSGGVDSSTTAALLQEQGHQVTGVHMKLHDTPDIDNQCDTETKTCCGADDALDARRVSRQLGIDCFELNLKKVFQKFVIDDFKAAYKAGYTPNPCVACNAYLKFHLLLKYARNLGYDALATGHYARIENNRLYPGLDSKKDQSYFLWPIQAKDMKDIVFPLGHLTKEQVRNHAERFNLITAKKRESMDICFIPGGDYRQMLDFEDSNGFIIDIHGEVLGVHRGYWNFTIGQRRGLNLDISTRMYVVRIIPEKNEVIVAPEPIHDSFSLIKPNWIQPPLPEMKIKIRHSRFYAKCSYREGRVTTSPDFIAPGQSAVFYHPTDNNVIGGGYISRC